MKYTLVIIAVITHSVFKTQPISQPFIGRQAPTSSKMSAAASAESGIYAYPPLRFPKQRTSDNSAARPAHTSAVSCIDVSGSTPSRISSAAGSASRSDAPAITLPDRTASAACPFRVGKVVHVTGDKLTFETGEDRVRIEITKWAVSSNEGKGANKETSDSEESLGN